MATITSVGTGDWGTAGTWDAGVPVDNDTVVIAVGHVVTFNVDQSGFANGIAGITVTGTLSLTRTAGTYYLKIKAATTINGAGTFDCGTSVSPIPFAAKHTITGGSGWFIQGSGGLTMTVYAAEPVTKTILLTALEPISETVLAVDTDVTGDIWADGDTIRIDNINKAAQSEVRVIAAGGIAAGTITITAGLTAAKIVGTVVSLITRNVNFIGLGDNLIKSFTSGKLTIAGGQFTAPAKYIFNACIGAAISGGTFSASTSAVQGGSGAIISGGVFTGMSYIVLSSTGVSITDGYFGGSSRGVEETVGASVSGGVWKGNDYVLSGSRGATITDGTFLGNASGAQLCVGATIFGGTFSYGTNGIGTTSALIKNAVFSNNVQDINSVVVTAFNTLFGSTTENLGYTSLSKVTYSESIDHDQVAGAFKAWTKGGVTASATTPVPTGYTTSYIITLADASNEGFWQREYAVGAGASVNITMNLRKSASMTYLPRCIIFNKAETDPFAGGAGISTFTMTDSVDTFEASTYTYYNSTANDVTLVIRFQGKNASGTVTTALLVEQINVDLTTLINNLATVDTVVDAIKVSTDAMPTVTQIRQEMDTNSTRLSTIATDTTTDIPALIAALNTDSVLSATVEGTITVQQALRIVLAEMIGKATGGGTATITYRNTGDDKDRVIMTVDENGNRSAITTDLT